MNLDFHYKNTNPIFTIKQTGETPVLQFSIFNQTDMVKHGFSTRLGGVSTGIYASMNLGQSRGDDPEKVQRNYRIIADTIGVSTEWMVCSDQTHTTNVKVVTKEDAGKGLLQPKDYQDIDGLITNVPGLCLVTYYADCVPLLFLDLVQKVIASSHSGWRGTVGHMGQKTIQRMQSEFGCRAEHILAAIGPSICQDCYEVSEDVIQQFQQAFPEDMWADLYYRKENGKYQLNLWKANEWILLNSGILPEHLAVTNLCTCCNSDLLFSHRASHGKRGTLAAFLALKED
mgnify:FL=1